MLINTVYVEELVRFGLSEKEAKVYLALLELEVATVNEIAKTAEINRSSTYVVLESLQVRGLVSVSAGKKIKKYVVAPPEQLAHLAERQAKTQTEIKEEIEHILPDLKSLYKGSKQKPRVRIYEGREGIINSFEDTLSTEKSTIKIFSSANRIYEYLQNYIIEYAQKRTEKKIKMRGIHPDEEASRQLLKYMPSFDSMILIPPEKFNFSSEIAIYDDKVGFVSFSEQIAIVGLKVFSGV